MVDIVRAHPELGDEVAQLFESGVALKRRQSPGAAGPDAAPLQRQLLLAEIANAKEKMS
jgi:hypothetical protein